MVRSDEAVGAALQVAEDGSHRRAQGVIVPVEIWEILLEQAENEADTELAQDRLTRDDGRRLSRAKVGRVFDQFRAGRSA